MVVVVFSATVSVKAPPRLKVALARWVVGAPPLRTASTSRAGRDASATRRKSPLPVLLTVSSAPAAVALNPWPLMAAARLLAMLAAVCVAPAVKV